MFHFLHYGVYFISNLYPYAVLGLLFEDKAYRLIFAHDVDAWRMGC
jgi:hypothetical protein